MATTLYLVSRSPTLSYAMVPASNGAAYTNLRGSTGYFWVHYGHALMPSRGSGSTNLVADTVAGPTAGIEGRYRSNTTDANGFFISPPFSSQVTISGSISFNFWGWEDAMNTNTAINARVMHMAAATGTMTEILKTANTAELGTSTSVQTFSGTPTSTTFYVGDRLVVIPFGDDASGVNMGSGGTWTVAYSGVNSGQSGDTYITLTETVTVYTSAPSGTTVYPTNTSAGINPGSATEYEMWTGRGSSAQSAVTNTAAGPTSPIQVTATGGGTAVEWYTQPLAATTLSGPVLINVRKKSSDTMTYALVRAEIARTDSDGTNATVWAMGGENTTPTTTETSYPFWVCGPDLSISANQRLRVRFYIDDCGGGGNYDAWMGASKTLTFYYNGSAGATGDCYLTFSNTLESASVVNGSFTAAAWIAGRFKVDASIAGTVNRTMAVASILLRNSGDLGLDIDAWLDAVRTGSFALDATQHRLFLESLVTDAILHRLWEPTGPSVDAVHLGPNPPYWTTPAYNVAVSTAPTFAFTSPTSSQPLYFHLQLDKVNTFDGAELRNIRTMMDGTGWEYWDGASWVPMESGWMPAAYAGNEVRHTVQTALTSGVWYRRARMETQ